MLINVEKCEFAVSKITYLGFEMDKFGYRPDSRKMKCITEMKAPETIRGIRGVLGFTNFYRHLLPKSWISVLTGFTAGTDFWHFLYG